MDDFGMGWDVDESPAGVVVAVTNDGAGYWRAEVWIEGEAEPQDVSPWAGLNAAHREAAAYREVWLVEDYPPDYSPDGWEAA